MSGTDTAIAELNESTTEPEAATAPPRPAALPYLSVANARDAIAWYIDTFGASLVGEMYEMDDGRVGHAELQIGDGVLYLADEYPELGLKAPVATGGFGEPDAACRRHRRHPGAGSGTWRRRCSARPTRTTAPAAPPSSTRSGTGGCSADRSPGRRSRSSTATSATSRCGRPTPTAPRRSTATCSAGPTIRRPIRSPTPASASALYSRRPAADAVLLLRGDRPRRGAAGDLDGGGRSTRSSSSTSARLDGATDSRVRRSAVYQPQSGSAPSGAQRRWARRTFVHHL